MDFIQNSSTALEKLFNDHQVRSASERLYHHPTDERLVPDELPEPTPVSIRSSGEPFEFDAAPVFGPGGPSSPDPR